MPAAICGSGTPARLVFAIVAVGAGPLGVGARPWVPAPACKISTLLGRPAECLLRAKSLIYTLACCILLCLPPSSTSICTSCLHLRPKSHVQCEQTAQVCEIARVSGNNSRPRVDNVRSSTLNAWQLRHGLHAVRSWPTGKIGKTLTRQSPPETSTHQCRRGLEPARSALRRVSQKPAVAQHTCSNRPASDDPPSGPPRHRNLENVCVRPGRTDGTDCGAQVMLSPSMYRRSARCCA